MVSSKDLRVEAYGPHHQRDWDDFVSRSKNATFLHHRGFLEYHADRFEDCSAVVFAGNKLVALLPASWHGQEANCEVRSHGGLTYGGVLSDRKMSAATMLQVFEVLAAHYRQLGAASILYKTIPHIYHRLPAEEDRYALFRFGATLERRDVAAAIHKPGRAPLTKGRKWALSKARAAGHEVQESDDFERFFELEAQLLDAKYGTKPVHTAAEMRLLHERFPDRVRLFTVSEAEQLAAGTIVFDCDPCLHVQYIASTQEGRDSFAVDALFSHLIDTVFGDKQWFDFGISTERDGQQLNAALAANKESWGARSVVYDFYRLDL